MTRREIVQGAMIAMALTSGVAACAPVPVMAALAIPQPGLARRHGDDHAIDAHVAEFIRCVRRHRAVIRLEYGFTRSGRTLIAICEADGGSGGYRDIKPVLDADSSLMRLPGARERLIEVCERLAEGGASFVERPWPTRARRPIGEWAVPLPA